MPYLPLYINNIQSPKGKRKEGRPTKDSRNNIVVNFLNFILLHISLL
jgi:hypothetical protein